MGYEDLLLETEQNDLIVKEKKLPLSDGRIKGKRIAIRKDIPTLAKKADVLAEELGHYYTTVGNIINQNDVANRKQERRARLWAYDKRIGLTGIIEGYRNHCQSRHDLAEYLDVTEGFLQEAINCYHEKYGLCVDIDGYTIFFEPSLAVMEKF